MNLIIAAISLGFLGSFHCIGMCGPIALALPLDRTTNLKKTSGIIVYNIGRALTYSAFGVLFGFIGKGFAIFGLQQLLSIVLGSIILVSVLLPAKVWHITGFSGRFFSLFSSLKNKISKQFSRKSLASLFSIGLLNGLLPCGFVYMALAGAMASGGPEKGAVFMAGFGLGTIPAMMAVSWFADLITSRFRSGLRNAFPYVVSIMAILMIMRGMNLGIPYISPKMSVDSKTEMSCHIPKKICCHK